MKKPFDKLTPQELSDLLKNYQATAKKTSYGWCVGISIKEFYAKQNAIGVLGVSA